MNQNHLFYFKRYEVIFEEGTQIHNYIDNFKKLLAKALKIVLAFLAANSLFIYFA
jgi:hypothetical protein